jgi:hypothetical protein
MLGAHQADMLLKRLFQEALAEALKEAVKETRVVPGGSNDRSSSRLADDCSSSRLSF